MTKPEIVLDGGLVVVEDGQFQLQYKDHRPWQSIVVMSERPKQIKH